MKPSSFLAFDLGAESGRTLAGTLEGSRLDLRELTRFPNGIYSFLGGCHWNVYRLFDEMKAGLRAGAEELGGALESVAVDTWGVDFGLLASDGALLGLPYSYRDPRNLGAMERCFETVPRERVYALTGNQFLPFNTLFQLTAMKRDRSPLLEAAADLLFMPDLFNYFFTGVKKTEFTFATTSQLFDPRKRAWADTLFEAMDLPRSVMQEVVEPGTVLGNLDEAVAAETGAGKLPVTAAASHDTGSAVAAVPAEEEDWAYISSGTWSLLGVEVREPIVTAQALEKNFTNEGGVGGTFRFLKNITGLWLLQQCKKRWEADHPYPYEKLMEMAKGAKPFQAVIDPDWEAFLNPADMNDAIADCCRETGQTPPEGPAQTTRVILESLALKYRTVLDQLRGISPRPVNRMHIIGGGARNGLLCQFTANALGLPVIAGPVEATAIGNIMVQALAAGRVGSHEEMRDVIRRSFTLERYEPEAQDVWENAGERFRDLYG